MKAAATTLGLFLLVTIIGAGQAPQSAADLFQKALILEKAEGNLEEAIALFQKVVDRGDDEVLAAQAQLHIGLCYEKLGLGKARDAYQRVIDRFPRQVEAVKAARDKLALLAEVRKDKPVESREIRVRRVFDDYGPEWGNALSSDGRCLAYTDWSTGDMAVVDLVTKERRRITADGGMNKPARGFGETSAFSGDDKRVAYGWQGGDQVNELRVVNFDGTDRRTLFRDGNTIWIRPYGWTPDGRIILLNLMKKDGTSEIASFSLPENKLASVRKLDVKDPEMALSPDGRLIAYSMAPDRPSAKRDVFIMNMDGTGHEAIVSNPADDYLLGWSPDGHWIVFASDRSGANGVWGIGIKNGRAEGYPRWLKNDLKPTPVRLTPDGTLHYMSYESLFEVYTVPIDPGTGKPLGAPAAVKSSRTGIRTAPDWSPDGRRLAYKYFSRNEERAQGMAQISILDLRTGEELQVATDLTSGNPYLGPRWAPDGRSVLILGSRVPGETGIYRVDIPGGETRLLVKFEPQKNGFQAAWSPDGKSVFYTLGNPAKILRRDLASGTDVEMASINASVGYPRIAPSADGTRLAFTSMGPDKDPLRLMIIPTAGGSAREIYRIGETGFAPWILWTVDGKEIWLKTFKSAPDGKGNPTVEFLGISPDGQNVRKLELGAKQGADAAPWQILSAMDLRLHPDGNQVAFWAGQSKLELWALENFLPAPPKSK